MSILERGQIFGLEECEQKNKEESLLPRKQTVTCVKNHSCLLFMSYQHFAEHVLSNVAIEADVKFENVVRKYFYKMRHGQHQQTIWNPKIARDPNMV